MKITSAPSELYEMNRRNYTKINAINAFPIYAIFISIIYIFPKIRLSQDMQKETHVSVELPGFDRYRIVFLFHMSLLWKCICQGLCLTIHFGRSIQS